MPNSLYNLLNAPTRQIRGPLGQAGNIVQQFNRFRNQFQGDPRQQIQQLLNSGRISQADYNRAVQIANAMKNML